MRAERKSPVSWLAIGGMAQCAQAREAVDRLGEGLAVFLGPLQQQVKMRPLREPERRVYLREKIVVARFWDIRVGTDFAQLVAEGGLIDAEALQFFRAVK